MKVELTKADLASIKKVRQESPVCKYFDNKQNVTFTIGDILIKKVKDWDDKWHNEQVNYSTKMAKRYVYVHQDEHGVGFIKLLKTSTGTLGKETWCIADLISDGRTKFVVDPEFADSVFLGDGSFDIKNVRKKARAKKARIEEINRNSSVKFEKLSEINKWLSTFGPGQNFYTGNETGDYTEQFKIKSITKKYISRLNEDLKYEYDSNNFDLPDALDEKQTYVIEYEDEFGGTEETTSANFMSQFLYASRPLTIEDEVE